MSISMQMSRGDLVQELRNPDFQGPMIHLRSWADLHILMNRAADLLWDAEVDAIVKDALSDSGDS